MALSRKRERELKRLRSSAGDLWDDQRQVLDHASKVLREAGRQVGYIGSEEVAPRVRNTYESRVRPAVETGLGAVHHAGDVTRNKFKRDVVPGIASAIASTLAVIEVAKDTRVKDAVREIRKAGDRAGHALDTTSRRVKKAAKKYGKKIDIAPQKKGAGPGTFIAVGVGVVALAGLGYAVWQTLRADDDLWITDEAEELVRPEAL